MQPPLVSIPLEALPIGAATLDKNHIIVAANQRFVRLCGHRDVLTTRVRLVDTLSKRDRPAIEAAFADLALLDGQMPQPRSVKVRRAAPPSLWLSLDMARVNDGSAASYIVCLQAVHRRRSDGAPRGKTSNGLAGSRARDREPWPPSLTALAHELRGPLTAIRGWAHMSAAGMIPSEKVSDALAIIERNATSVSELVESLFDLSRRATGSLVLERRFVDLNAVARFVVESAQPAALRRGVALTLSCPPTTVGVDGDALRLQQVVRNIVDNAIKFTPAGGHVDVHTWTDSANAELIVSDDGLGISQDLLPIIFEPFCHDDGAVRPPQKGLGLGLALVRELVQLHQGDVRASSEGRGQGSTFVVRLPLARSAATHRSQEARPIKPS